MIEAGRVRSGTLVLVKASQMLDTGAPLELLEPERFVSRGGYKLEAALDTFAVDPAGRTCIDLGASTGGFTDCLLQHGAAHVIAVDVGRAQLHQSLRSDHRVTLLEGTNARDLPELPADHARASLFVADLSFISLTKVLPAVSRRLPPATEGLVLLKPQFEAGPKDVPRGGVIRDPAVLERVKAAFSAWLDENCWRLYGIIPSPIKGGDGNTEFLAHVRSPERDGHHA